MTPGGPVADLGADPAVTATAAELLAGSVPAPLAGLVPYHSAQYPAYLRAALAPAPDTRTVLLRAVTSGGALVAVADWRVLASELFLNGLFVRAEHRRRGYGRQLLLDGVQLARRLGVQSLALDVAGDNGAVGLYRSLGFVAAGTAAWFDLADGAAGGGDTRLRFLDWPLFCAHRAAYGFGDLTARTAGGTVVKIRMTGTALRLTGPPDPQVSAAQLRRMVGATRVCVVDEAGASWAGPPFARFIRMSRPVCVRTGEPA